MLSVGLLVAGMAIASALALNAFQDNMMFYVELDDVAAGNTPDKRAFRVGGLVESGSVAREDGSMQVEFALTDTVNRLVVEYEGVLPVLFREGQGIIAHGQLDENGVFVADEILAKHDENYMAPEVAASLKEKGYVPPEMP
jgi:cytochrome c-type biogenesis protein CcmE